MPQTPVPSPAPHMLPMALIGVAPEHSWGAALKKGPLDIPPYKIGSGLGGLWQCHAQAFVKESLGGGACAC